MVDKIVDILLVEDRPEDAELAIMALSENNLSNRLKWVKDGQEALDFLFAENEYSERENCSRPKLVLLDLKMPKVGGLEVLKKIRNHSELNTLPVVVLTTSKEERDIVEAYDLGVNSYIVKPVDFEGFMKSINELGFYWLVLNEPPFNKR